MTLHIRLYNRADKEACLAVFDGNTPAFFAPHERAEFEQFLDEAQAFGVYLVAEEDGVVVGCGGYFVVPEQGVAGLMWGMVERTRQRQGIGRTLLLARLAAISMDERAQRVVLDTSQHSQGFFATLGFGTSRVTPNHYAPGMDRHDMELLLTPTVRAHLIAIAASEGATVSRG